jgi:hypothetical protein
MFWDERTCQNFHVFRIVPEDPQPRGLTPFSDIAYASRIRIMKGIILETMKHPDLFSKALRISEEAYMIKCCDG